MSDPVTLWTVAHQTLCPWGLSRQDYWSGLLFPSPGVLPNPGIKLASLKSLALQMGSFPQAPPGKPLISGYKVLYVKFLSLIKCLLKAIVLLLLILCITWSLLFKTFVFSGILLCVAWGGYIAETNQTASTVAPMKYTLIYQSGNYPARLGQEQECEHTSKSMKRYLEIQSQGIQSLYQMHPTGFKGRQKRKRRCPHGRGIYFCSPKCIYSHQGRLGNVLTCFCVKISEDGS